MTTPIYRPPGYGPAPTVEEHRAAPGVEWCSEHVTTWLHRASDDIIRVRTLSEVGGRLLYNGAVANLYGEWCLLDPATNLPCPIGTPPETEGIYNADGQHVGTWLARAVAPRTDRERLERDLAEAALAEAYAEARWKASDGDPGEHLYFSYIAHQRGTRAAARALADHIIKEKTP